MKKLCLILLLAIAASLYAQKTTGKTSAPAEPEAPPQKYALVIGNGAYTGGLGRLTNPVNDANDIAAALEYLGFTVDKVLNGSQQRMVQALISLKQKLGESKNSYGFFFYAGHGVQLNGENFLIPVNANIPNENYLQNQAVSVQAILDDLNDAGNNLNIIVLDACRDNPFGWSRSGSRGLAIVGRQPADSIVVYATSAGQKASDGEGRNGMFTKELLHNLMTPGLEVTEVFRRTGLDVTEASQGQQIPAIYNQFFRTAYLGVKPDIIVSMPSQDFPSPGKMRFRDAETKLWTVGASIGCGFEPWLMGTVRGTIAPIRNTFLGLGFDIGFISATKDAIFSYYSPFAHIAYFMPFHNFGLYAGAGFSYVWGNIKLQEGALNLDTPAADFIAGINLFDMIDISYTFRTNLKKPSNKLSLGYTYRFKLKQSINKAENP